MTADPIRIFVGCAPDAMDAESQCVLEYTLRKHTARDLDITWMIASRDRKSPFFGWDMSRWATPFSAFRWAVPSLCGFEGRAIYMDSDTIVQADIGELWDTPMGGGKVVVARDVLRFCVCLWNCKAAKPVVAAVESLKRPEGHHRQSQDFALSGDLVQRFTGHWNYLDEDVAPLANAKIVHYSRIDTQPHLRYAVGRLAQLGMRHWYDGPISHHPRDDIVQLFDEDYREAVQAGYTVDRYAPSEVFGELHKRSMVGYRGLRRSA